MSQQSPIFVKTEIFMLWLFQHTAKFPRHERFRLAKRIDDMLFNFHDHLLYAAYEKDAQFHLQEAALHLNKIRTYLQLAVEMQYTTPKQYQYAAQQITEIGKLLGGWMKKA